jgi:polysaccharide pyruvyl transferase WcaK-like protein
MGITTVASSKEAGPRIVLLGATITGNRGAESMLRAAVQHVRDSVPGVKFSLLSLYPRDDRKENTDPDLEVVDFSPIFFVFAAFPMAMALAILARLHLPHRFLLRFRAVREIYTADLVIDLSGISFVDGRGLGILLYNVLMVLVPRILGTPVVKYSQALGPFHNPLNRLCAQWILPKVSRLAARGRITRANLDAISLPPGIVRECADAAFAMRIGPEARERIKPLLQNPIFSHSVVCVSPSSVVESLCRGTGVDYPAVMASFIRYLIDEQGYRVLLLAHSFRPGRTTAKNNDRMVCRAVYEKVDRPGECVCPEEVLNAEALRALIGSCRFLVASRFHAMISGLAMEVPILLVGWSHKYAEVLEVFDLGAYALDYAEVSFERLKDLFHRMEKENAETRSKIRRILPSVVESSLSNVRMVMEVLSDKKAKRTR